MYVLVDKMNYCVCWSGNNDVLCVLAGSMNESWMRADKCEKNDVWMRRDAERLYFAVTHCFAKGDNIEVICEYSVLFFFHKYTQE